MVGAYVEGDVAIGRNDEYLISNVDRFCRGRLGLTWEWGG